MDETKVTTRKRHQLTLRSREQLSIDGVVHVESFDDREVVLETDAGMMVIRGDGLHIKELNLENGGLQVDGTVIAMEYLGERPGKKTKGFLGKLFR